MKKEFGKWLMDIAKYIFTAVIISSYFSGMQQGTYRIGIMVGMLLLGAGLLCCKEHKEDNELVEKNNKRRK